MSRRKLTLYCTDLLREDDTEECCTLVLDAALDTASTEALIWYDLCVSSASLLDDSGSCADIK